MRKKKITHDKTNKPMRKTSLRTKSNDHSSLFNNFFNNLVVNSNNYCFWWNNLNDGWNYFTENIRSITGYSAEELKLMPGKINDIIHPEDHPLINDKLNEFLINAKSNHIPIIYRLIKKDHSVIWIKEERYFEKNKIGEIIFEGGFISDITSHKNKEEELLSSIEDLQRLNNSKDGFISILSHDLKAPFTSILGFSEILMNEPGLPAQERNEYLNYIFESSQHQLHFINYLLDWSRLHTGRIKTELQRIKVSGLLFNCISSLTGNAVRKNIEIKTNISDDIYIMADERMMNQVLVNLISNSIKYSMEGYRIDIFADRYNDGYVEFIIKDYGVGISEHNKEKLFQIDKMFSTNGTKGEKGTGLGLSLVKEIISKHGGEIWFYSKQGKGSEFHFTIPLSPNYILMIDNDEVKFNKFKSIVNECLPAYDLVRIQNGFDALVKINNNIPALIIINHQLPLLDGINLLEIIRNSEKYYSIPVFVIIDEDEAPMIDCYQKLGAEHILVNPVNEDVLKSNLLREHSRSRI